MKVGIILAEGFEECEALIVVDMLRRANIMIDMIGLNSIEVISSHNITIKSDLLLDDCDIDSYDGIILPGGKLGTSNLDNSEMVKKIVSEFLAEGKLVAAICAAPSILGKMGLLRNRNYTCFPTFDGEYGGTYNNVLAIEDGNLITGRGMGASIEFGRLLIRKLSDEETLSKVEEGIQYYGKYVF